MAIRSRIGVLLALSACSSAPLTNDGVDLATADRPASTDLRPPDSALDLGGDDQLVRRIFVVPCCGGPAPMCVPADDGGVCPYGPCLHPNAAGPCADKPCTPAPGYFVDVPASCGSPVSCDCFAQDPCYRGGGSCPRPNLDERPGALECVCA